jgi:hypothetical protein
MLGRSVAQWTWRHTVAGPIRGPRACSNLPARCLKGFDDGHQNDAPPAVLKFTAFRNPEPSSVTKSSNREMAPLSNWSDMKLFI